MDLERVHVEKAALENAAQESQQERDAAVDARQEAEAARAEAVAARDAALVQIETLQADLLARTEENNRQRTENIALNLLATSRVEELQAAVAERDTAHMDLERVHVEKAALENAAQESQQERDAAVDARQEAEAARAEAVAARDAALVQIEALRADIVDVERVNGQQRTEINALTLLATRLDYELHAAQAAIDELLPSGPQVAQVAQLHALQNQVTKLEQLMEELLNEKKAAETARDEARLERDANLVMVQALQSTNLSLQNMAWLLPSSSAVME